MTRTSCSLLATVALISFRAFGDAPARPKDKPAGPSPAVNVLSTENDAQKKEAAAQQLGDLSIAGTLSLSEKDQDTLSKVVQQYLKDSKSPPHRATAEAQILRLWYAALPALLQGLDSLETYSPSVSLLIQMKSDRVTKALIEKVRNNKDERQTGLLRFALQKMKAHKSPPLHDRKGITEEESERINKELIDPVLESM